MKKQIKKLHKFRSGNTLNALCKAPFTALCFEPNGYIKNCCASNEPIGRWPHTSIENAIGSAINTKIKHALKAMEFPTACMACKTDTLLGKQRSLLLNMFDHNKLEGDKIEFIEFSLENTCNLRCIMCNSYKSSNYCEQNITRNYYDNRFVEYITPYIKTLKIANFTGGEPFLIETNYAIWDILIERNPKCEIHIITNGSILNNRIKDLLNAGNFHISISLDALNNDLYEEIRVNAGYNTIMQNLQYFNNTMQNQGKHLNITSCPMQINYREIPKIGGFCKQNNFGFFLNPLIAPYHLALWTLPSKELKNISRYLKSENPFDKSDASYAYYNELRSILKKWAQKDNILKKQKAINPEKFFDTLLPMLIQKGVCNEKAEIFSKTLFAECDKKFYTEKLLLQFYNISDYYIEILNSPLINHNSIHFLITNYLYYSVFDC